MSTCQCHSETKLKNTFWVNKFIKQVFDMEVSTDLYHDSNIFPLNAFMVKAVQSTNLGLLEASIFHQPSRLQFFVEIQFDRESL